MLVEHGLDRLAKRDAFDLRAPRLLGLARRDRIASPEGRLEGGVIQAAIENLAERLHRCAAALRQIVGQIELEVGVDHRAVAKEFVQSRNRHLADLGARLLQRLERAIDDRGHFGILGSIAEELADDPNARALQ
jgi:hypothetical protein